MTRYADKSFTVGLGTKAFRTNYDKALGKIIARKCPKCGTYNEATNTHCNMKGCGTKLTRD
jgi:uncharacterized OB-fold protein